jgi:tetratricopeptide (TPR) repeat protein
MKYQKPIFIVAAFGVALAAPLALAQKPPAPAPGPRPAPAPQPSGPSSIPSAVPFPNPDSTQPYGDRVIIIRGRIATSDGTPIPHDAIVERVCNSRVRQQVPASTHGDFSMDLGSKVDSFLDASSDGTARDVRTANNSTIGIPLRELMNCEVRASVAGFRSGSIDLAGLTPSETIDVGTLVVHRTAKLKELTLSATIYKAPPNARKAFEKGLDAERKDQLATAIKYFEQAVEIYPRFTNAWFALGTVLKRQDQVDAARKAYLQATSIDSRFLPPYFSLASMAYKENNWSEVLVLTGHILDLDPMNHVSGYILDLDPIDYAEAYFYNAAADFNLNRFEDAEKSALKAERLDLRSRFPQLHLLLARIFARKNNYPPAISEIQAYLDLAPNAGDAAPVRKWMEELKKRNASEVASEKPGQK